jgi:hypothetical protein
MTTELLIMLLGMPLILACSILATTRIVWRRLSKRTEQEIVKIRNEYNVAMKRDEKLILSLKDVIKAQDEHISELKNHLS